MAFLSLSRPLILGSASPRRAELLGALGFPFDVKLYPTDEQIPPGATPGEAVAAIARQKAQPFQAERQTHLILTADTVVDLEGAILGKPKDAAEARAMLSQLSGQTHRVHSAFCLVNGEKETVEVDTAEVVFDALSPAEIDQYVATFQPLDKAGAYGIQEWIGMIGVRELRGSYFTVMGLPTHRVYGALRPYLR